MIQFPKIDKVLNDLLEEINNECTVNCGDDFGYFFNEDKITYALLVDSIQAVRFMEFAKSKGLEYDCGTFILCLMHEIGHSVTWDDLDDNLVKKCSMSKSKMDENSSFEYFNLPDEWAATEWAIEYINSNKDRIKKLAEDLQTAMTEENIKLN